MVSGQLTVYRGCTPVVDTRYENDDDGTLTERLVEAVATAEGIDVIELPSLYEVVDLDSLTRMFERHVRGPDEEVILGFRYDHWNVFVHSDGRICVCDGTQPTEPEPVFE